MFKLKYLELGPFRSFVKPQRIDFPDSGMVLFEGENGAGKSNVLLAIEHAFGSCPLPSTVLSSWQASDEPPTVNLGIQTDKGLLQLNRSKKLELIENQVEFKGSAAQKEEQLLKIIGLSAEVRQALTYRGQRSPGLFISKTNAEKGDFLVPLLDLVRFEKAQDVGDKKVKDLDEKATKLSAAYEAIEGTLTKPDEAQMQIMAGEILKLHDDSFKANKGEQDLKLELEKARTSNNDEAFAAQVEYITVNQLENLKSELTELQGNAPVFNLDNRELVKLSDNLAECQKRLDKIKADDQVKLNEHNKTKNDANKAIQSNKIEINKGIRLRKDIDRLDSDIKTLESNKCPTCDREWILAQAKLHELISKKNEILVEIHLLNKIELETSKLEELYSLIPAFVPDLNIVKFQSIIENLKEQIATERQKLNSAKSLFEAKHAKQVAEVRQKISDVIVGGEKVARSIKDTFISIERIFNNSLQNIQDRKNAINQQLNDYKVKVATLEAQENAYKNSQKQLQAKLAEKRSAEAELNIESDLLSLLGREGFLGSIFDEVLDEISTETNNTLSAVPNTSHVTLEFKSESVTQKGTVKKSIIPVITVGDYTAPIKSALSGGMLSVLELATDLAVMNVVSRRTGIVPGYLILDESFTGIDNKSKESCFELLQIYAKDRLIIVIDHDTEFKSLFDKVITVECINGQSIIK